MLKELIDEYYKNLQSDKEQHHFYITDAGKCSRAIFFKFKRAPKEELEPRVLRMFDHGDQIHRLIMKALFGIRNIHVVASEINIPPHELISGRADAIISDGKDLYVLDIKSMNGMVFDKLNEAKIENIFQVQLYLHYFRISKGLLLYVNKDTQDLKEFFVEYDEKLVNSLLKNFQDLKDKIKKDIVPKRLSDYPNNWQCRYCQFKELCRLDEGREIAWEEFRKKIESGTEDILSGNGKEIAIDDFLE